jgi:hypothetical protein
VCEKCAEKAEATQLVTPFNSSLLAKQGQRGRMERKAGIATAIPCRVAGTGSEEIPAALGVFRYRS